MNDDAENRALRSRVMTQENQISHLAETVKQLRAELADVALIVGKMRTDLTHVGGYENQFVSVPAGGVREYIALLENVLNKGDATR